MADRLAPGEPYRVLQLAGGRTAPFYVVPFDKDGIGPGDVGVESSDVIGGHGEISNEATFWMLLNQLTGSV